LKGRVWWAAINDKPRHRKEKINRIKEEKWSNNDRAESE